MADMSLGNLYDMNKAIIGQVEKAYSKKDLAQQIKKVWIPIMEVNPANNYYMLLCNELKYYTIIRFTEHSESKNLQACRELQECLECCGRVYAFDSDPDNYATVEIWVQDRETKEMHCFYLFGCDAFIVEV